MAHIFVNGVVPETTTPGEISAWFFQPLLGGYKMGPQVVTGRLKISPQTK